VTPGLDGVLDGVLDRVRTGLADAGGYVDDICRAAEIALGATGSSAGGDAARLRQAFTAVADRMNALVLAAGDPEALRAAGAAWIDDVARPVSALVGAATDDVLQTDDHWRGAAADAYRATLYPQQKALAAVVATGQQIDAELEDLAAAILRFWIAIGSACLGLVIALAGALGSAATVVGAPASAGLALAGVGALVVAGNSALSNLTEITSAAAARAGALERRLADGTAFPEGRWPRSTSGISTDARVTDGDASDWEVR
jgi:hypothetical protein